MHLADFVGNHKALLEVDLVYTADGSSHNNSDSLILLGVRGVLTLEMTVSGADFDSHSGNTGNIVPNPVWKMVELLNTMHDNNGQVLKEIELLKWLPYDQADVAEKIGYKDLNMDGASYYHKLTMELTFNIAGIESGYTGKRAKTIIPSTATVNMGIRLVAD